MIWTQLPFIMRLASCAHIGGPIQMLWQFLCCIMPGIGHGKSDYLTKNSLWYKTLDISQCSSFIFSYHPICFALFASTAWYLWQRGHMGQKNFDIFENKNVVYDSYWFVRMFLLVDDDRHYNVFKWTGYLQQKTESICYDQFLKNGDVIMINGWVQ